MKVPTETEFWYHSATGGRLHTMTLFDPSCEEKPFMRLGTRLIHIRDDEHVLRRSWHDSKQMFGERLYLRRGYEHDYEKEDIISSMHRTRSRHHFEKLVF